MTTNSTPLRAPSLSVLATLIGLFLFLGPAATDSFLPAISAIAEDLGANIRLVELTLPTMFIGGAVGHAIYGPLSDRFGRRPIIVGAAFLWTVAAVGGGVAHNVEILIFWRFVQGLTLAAGRIVGTAAARDVFEREPLRRLLSYTLLINSVSPVVSAPIGGLLVGGMGWRSVFVYQTAVGGLCFFLFLMLFTETLAEDNRRALKPSTIAATYGGIARNVRFLRYALVSGLVMGGVMVFLTNSSAVVINRFGVSPVEYGFQFSALMMVTISSTAVVARLNRHYSITTLIMAGGVLATAGGVAMLACALLGIERAAAVMLPMAVFMASYGVTLPQAVAGAMQPFPRTAGAASSVLGFSQFTVGAAAAWIVSRFADGTQMPMAVGIAVCGVVSLMVALLIMRAGPAQTD